MSASADDAIDVPLDKKDDSLSTNGNGNGSGSFDLRTLKDRAARYWKAQTTSFRILLVVVVVLLLMVVAKFTRSFGGGGGAAADGADSSTPSSEVAQQQSALDFGEVSEAPLPPAFAEGDGTMRMSLLSLESAASHLRRSVYQVGDTGGFTKVVKGPIVSPKRLRAATRSSGKAGVCFFGSIKYFGMLEHTWSRSKPNLAAIERDVFVSTWDYFEQRGDPSSASTGKGGGDDPAAIGLSPVARRGPLLRGRRGAGAGAPAPEGEDDLDGDALEKTGNTKTTAAPVGPVVDARWFHDGEAKPGHVRGMIQQVFGADLKGYFIGDHRHVTRCDKPACLNVLARANCIHAIGVYERQQIAFYPVLIVARIDRAIEYPVWFSPLCPIARSAEFEEIVPLSTARGAQKHQALVLPNSAELAANANTNSSGDGVTLVPSVLTNGKIFNRCYLRVGSCTSYYRGIFFPPIGRVDDRSVVTHLGSTRWRARSDRFRNQYNFVSESLVAGSRRAVASLLHNALHTMELQGQDLLGAAETHLADAARNLRLDVFPANFGYDTPASTGEWAPLPAEAMSRNDGYFQGLPPSQRISKIRELRKEFEVAGAPRLAGLDEKAAGEDDGLESESTKAPPPPALEVEGDGAGGAAPEAQQAAVVKRPKRVRSPLDRALWYRKRPLGDAKDSAHRTCEYYMAKYLVDACAKERDTWYDRDPLPSESKTGAWKLPPDQAWEVVHEKCCNTFHRCFKSGTGTAGYDY